MGQDMARIRSIHPGAFTDEAFVSLSPMARWFFVGLWCHAFDDGVFDWKPLGLKMKIIPGDNDDAAALLAEIERAGLIVAFTVGERRYGAIRNFCRWQRPKKPTDSGVMTNDIRVFVGLSASQFGTGSEQRGVEASLSDEPDRDEGSRVPNQFGTGSEPVRNQFGTSSEISSQREEGGGKREEEKEESSLRSDSPFESAAQPMAAPPRPRASRLPTDWEPDQEGEAFAVEVLGSPVASRAEADKFRDYWRGVPGAKGLKLDWPGTWRNWVRRAAERPPTARAPPSHVPPRRLTILDGLALHDARTSQS